MIKIYRKKIVWSEKETQLFSDKIEQRRQNNLLHTENKKVWVRSFTTGRLLHHALCHYLELEEQETPAFQIGYGENGKPFLLDYKEVHYNLSHSGDWILCAVSDQPVGIDIQQKSSMRRGLCDRVFSEEEKKLWQGKETDAIFFPIWCVKEGYIKLTGKGLKKDLRQLTASFGEQLVIDQGKAAAYFVQGNFGKDYCFGVCMFQREQQVEWMGEDIDGTGRE